MRTTSLRTARSRIIDRQNIDNRTHIARKFDDMVSAIRSDLGGSDLTTLQLSLIEAYVGAAVSLNDMKRQQDTGQPGRHR